MFIFRSRKNIISSQVIQARSDKLNKRTLRDAKKKIKKGVLSDSYSFALYLPTIDHRYAFLEADISNATRVSNYAELRAKKVAETRQLLDFFSQDCVELERLSEIVSKKGRDAGRAGDAATQHSSSVDLSKLKANFEALTGGEV